jgi:hypothetical protein
MRFYVFTPGSPGYISAEVAIREIPTDDPDEPRGWADDRWAGQYAERIITRTEALMRPVYRQALEAWERGDDAMMQRTEVAKIFEDRRGTAALEAAEGCSVAQAALVADDDERIHEAVNRHAHEGCGWRFPDEPRLRRALIVVR